MRASWPRILVAALYVGALACGTASSRTADSEAALLPVPLTDDLLLVFSQPKPGQEAALSRWYEQHLREFVQMPGVRAAQRFTLVKQRKISDELLDQVAMYDISAAAVARLNTEVKARMSDGRIAKGDAFYEPSMFHLLYRPLAPPTMARDIHGADPTPMGKGTLSENYLVVLSDPASPEQEDAYSAWYDDQHVPDVLRVPGFESAQRFVRVGGAWRMPRYLVIFKFKSRDVAATNGEIGRRIREKITVMSPAFGGDGAKGAIAAPAGPVIRASRVRD